MVRLQRVKENPILTPTDLPWENMRVFNPGAVTFNGEILLLYRAMGKGDDISRIGLAKSKDGIKFIREKEPIYCGKHHPSETFGIEDVRVVKIEDTFYLVYTAASKRKFTEKPDPKWDNITYKKPQIGLSTTKDFKNYFDYDVIVPGIEGKDATLFPKKINGEYYLLYRKGPDHTFLTSSETLNYWPEKYFVFDKRPGFWDSKRVGIGCPPIETEIGWLIFYHGVDEKDVYRLGILFLDLKNPEKIIYRSSEPIFEPETDYEKFGFVPNVVFTCGVVEKNEQYFVYYGAADECIGLATIDKKSVMNLL